MRDRIESYARRLEHLSTVELSRSAERLVSRERGQVAALIAHLAEISRRNGHLELGYRSLFDYCVTRLRLSESSVWNRTQVAGVSRRFPQVLEHLSEGKVSLSVLGVLAPRLTEENVERLLAEAEGKTKREVKEIVAALDPKPAAEPMIRRNPVPSGRPPCERRQERLETAAPVPSLLPRAHEPRKPSGSVEVARPEVYTFRFSAGRGLKEKLERLAEVLGIDDSTGRMPEILEKALDLALEKKDPKRKLERRRKREESRARPRPDEAVRESVEQASQDSAQETRGRSRYIPSTVRERVLARACYQCEYTGPGGVRCAARAGLEIDHIEPWAKGGSSGEENLRVFCRRHNLFSASREFGEGFMRGKIDGDRRSVAWSRIGPE